MRFFSKNEPQLLADGAIYAKVREIITAAEKSLVIVSPYVDPTDDFVRQLEAAAVERRVAVRILFRKDRLLEYAATPWMVRLYAAGVSFGVIERLHSKVYRNESAALVTSMNFYASSGENSFEVGILFDSSHALAGQLEGYLRSLEPHVEELEATGGRSSRGGSGRHRTVPAAAPAPRAASAGYCIRCKERIPLNPDRPYCGADFESWSRYGNEDYEDKACHACGDRFPATKRKPLCDDCYR